MVLSLSIFIAGTIAIFRFGQINNVYRPFIYLIWIGCATEVLSIYFAYRYHNNMIIGAIYRLCESMFFLWFFSRLGIFKNRRKLLYLSIAAFIMIWLIDNFSGHSVNANSYTYYFDIVYALSIVLLSIKAVNNLLFTEKVLLKNSTFLICMGLIIFFTYQIIQRLFGLYGLKESFDFRRNVQSILFIVNCFTNLIFALAVLFMRKRETFKFRF